MQAPNVLMIAWDDVGYATMDCFGGPVKCPNMKRIADMGVVCPDDAPAAIAVMREQPVQCHAEVPAAPIGGRDRRPRQCLQVTEPCRNCAGLLQCQEDRLPVCAG